MKDSTPLYLGPLSGLFFILFFHYGRHGDFTIGGAIVFALGVTFCYSIAEALSSAK